MYWVGCSAESVVHLDLLGWLFSTECSSFGWIGLAVQHSVINLDLLGWLFSTECNSFGFIGLAVQHRVQFIWINCVGCSAQSVIHLD